MNEKIYDLLVIGGGINGVGVAVDAQGRGLQTALVEMRDLAWATSSASSKLIHGGLRYLEHYEFRLVKEALNERETVYRKAPHIVKPMRFRLPHRPHLRPAWMIRVGLFLYDMLGKRDILPGSKFIRFNQPGAALKQEITKGFEYSDCWVDDARLVVLNAMQFRSLGGDVFVQTKCVGVSQEKGLWHVQLRNEVTGEEHTMKAKGLVNAAGPWVKTLLTKEMHRSSPRGIRLIKGSHMVVPKLHDEDEAYILQNEDGRIVFVIPYLDEFSIVGTTDVEHKDAPETVAISNEEIDYLCDVVNAHFKKQISPADVVWTYAGVRPLCDDESDSAQAITRDYTVELETEGELPLLSIFGGKLTTYRKLAESALRTLKPFYPQMGAPWTADSVLPGGDLPGTVVNYSQGLQNRYPFLTARTAKRFATTYGSRCELFLKDAQSEADMGQKFGEGFFQKEVDYLLEYEFAMNADDILWRRTKMGLFLNEDQQAALAEYLAGKHPRAAEPYQPMQASA
ncbi:Glycerol-3-phosphate dehydrogenase [Hahella chejuensis KCTC 2396]|uniref:Glycerol-3-phosphate dehydrogenase n=1 Tax=Hahella chejuensis (strain KCTC 2396) TaxID=349521 RepID=Q2S6Z5_HAHCH|nr:glycerol-3-phosphate dehydrogenase [Hahella chejuensis]ABC33579.1 Glycerol-3-phosphate dehydrogenase [Hahella chejuensis KCTC 2396]